MILYVVSSKRDGQEILLLHMALIRQPFGSTQLMAELGWRVKNNVTHPPVS